MGIDFFSKYTNNWAFNEILFVHLVISLQLSLKTERKFLHF